MSEDALRDEICYWARSMFERGLTGGGSGNLSARTPDGGLLVTPTGSSLARLDPARLSKLAPDSSHVSGDPPTKEVALHTAFYDSRPDTGGVVHLHSTYATALSMLPDADPDNLLPPLTAYAIMRLGKVQLLGHFRPGDPAMGDAVRALGGRRAAVVLANHGPVVAGRSFEAAVFAMEELEETARLAMLTRGQGPRLLTEAEIADIVETFGVEWD